MCLLNPSDPHALAKPLLVSAELVELVRGLSIGKLSVRKPAAAVAFRRPRFGIRWSFDQTEGGYAKEGPAESCKAGKAT